MSLPDPARNGHRAGPSGARVLIVDDEPTLRTVLAHMLQSWGHVVEEAGTAAEALLAAAQPFDLILLDISLRGASGFIVAAEIHARQPDVYIIACTGHGDTLDPALVERSGIRQVLPKPLRNEELRRVVEEGLRERLGRSPP